MVIKNKIFFVLGIVLILSGIGIFTFNQLRTPDYLALSETDFVNIEIEKKKEPKKVEEKKVGKEKKLKERSTQKKETKKIEVEIKPTKESIIEKTPVKVKEEKTVNETPSGEKLKRFYIISGVFSVEENANIHVDNLKKEGYNNALVIGKVNGLYNVSFGSYNSREDAEKDLSEIKEKFQSSAWILYI